MSKPNQPAVTVVSDTLVLEVCVDSVESAIAAVRGGADRLEVCGNLAVAGGVTPSYGLVKCIQNTVDAPLMILIRPRVGDFAYSREEVQVMLEDIKAFKRLGGIRGFVIGALTEEGRVHSEYVKLLVDEILPLEGTLSKISKGCVCVFRIEILAKVSFHRAFDMTRDPEEALRDIADIGGISRILTSGQVPKAPDGLPTLKHLFEICKELIEDEAWGLTIMPGSGLNAFMLPTVLDALLPLGLREIHLSGGKWEDGGMEFKRGNMGFGVAEEEWGVWRTKEAEVRKARRVLMEVNVSVTD